MRDSVIFLGFLILCVIVFVPYAFAISRTRALRREIEELREQAGMAQRLTMRVWELEQSVARLRSTAAPPAVAVALPLAGPEPSVSQPEIEPATAPAPEPATQPLVPQSEFEPERIPEIEPAVAAERRIFLEPIARPAPAWRERLASQSGGDWESLVGGNWLNKLGVLVLIIGIALFLGYSFTKMGPAGRVGTALAVSGAMLASGIALEKKLLYRVFARGLIGGGWAGIYFTVYAMYAVDAAQVIASPWLASVLLSAVALGMIVHSLKYKSQAVTGLTYFIAFATLALTPVTAFSVVALLPLAASLLYLAWRFEWTEMALFGVFATYGVCASRGQTGASLFASQGIVGAYWLLFEAFVVLRAARPRPFSIPEQWIFPLNTLGAVALSLPAWQHAAPRYTYGFFAGFAAVLLVSAILRRRPEIALAARLANGAYEAPLTLSVLFCGIAIWLKFTTVWINFGLLLEAQLLFVAGLWLRQAYLQRLSAAVFGVATLKLLANDAPLGGPAGHWMEWTPVAVLSAALMYLNRALRRNAQYFSYFAAIAVLLIAGFETPQRFVAPVWFALAVVFFEVGQRRSLIEFRLQSYGLAALAILALPFNNIAHPHPSLPVGLCVLLSYWLAVQSTKLTGIEARWAPIPLSLATTVCGVLFAAFAAPQKFVGAAWLALAAILLELGLRGLPRAFRWQSYPVAVLGWLQVATVILFQAGKAMPLESRFALGIAALLSYAIAARVFASDRFHRTAGSLAGTLFASMLLWVTLPDPVVAVGWAILSLALMEAGLTVLPSMPNILVIQADLLGAATFARLFLANFVNAGSTIGISHRLLTVAPIIAAEYYAWYRRRGTTAARTYLYAAPILAVLLIRFEFGRVTAVVGWSALVVALWWFGVRRDNRDLRIQACVLALLCFARSWATNFYIPDSFAGISGRIAIAAFVVACFHGAQFIAPRSDQRSRGFFSILATALVSVLLYYEVRGGMLTVALGFQAACLMAAGFWARERILRLSGLVLLLVCILKLFLYDLRYLETLNRIFSFIVLGAVMVAVSWVYTRFRNQIQRYL